MKHTTGDWQLLRWGKELKGHDSDAAHEIHAYDGKNCGICVARLPVAAVATEHGTRKKRTISKAESLANGRMIAAGPELFNVLVATWIVLEASPDILAHVGQCKSKKTGKTLHQTVRDVVARVVK